MIIADCSQHALLLLLDLVSDAAKDASKNSMHGKLKRSKKNYQNIPNLVLYPKSLIDTQIELC